MGGGWNVHGLSDLFIDVEELPDGLSGLIQLICLGIAYSMILLNASTMISDGSELLLLVPSIAGIVGSVVLPVLGAVPDGAIVLFSGLGSDAQNQLNVGVGALAGSTIMLLTVPWFLSIVAGRVNLDANGQPDYKGKLQPADNRSLKGTGVELGPDVKTGSYIMLGTSVGYLLLQIAALVGQAEGNSEDSDLSHVEKKWAIVTFVYCGLCFVMYLEYQRRQAAAGQNLPAKDKAERVKSSALLTGVVNISGLVEQQLVGIVRRAHGLRDSEAPLLQSEGAPAAAGAESGGGPVSVDDEWLRSHPAVMEEVKGQLAPLLRPYFIKYDLNKSGELDRSETMVLLRDLRENLGPEELQTWFGALDRDHNGTIEFDEFVMGMASYCLATGARKQEGNSSISSSHHEEVKPEIEDDAEEGGVGGENDDDDEEEEEDEMPEEFLCLSPAEQQRRIKRRAAKLLTIGTLLVLLFSDPMVDVLTNFGERTGISSFYIGFTLAPLAANVSEVIAAYYYASKKTRKTIDVSMSTLQGACAMNNTFVLGIFALLIVAKGLAWEFFAETISILLIQVLMALMCQKGVHTLMDGLIILSFYPLALVVVIILEAIGCD